jgi:thiosulfate dehydrogenase [quinone] large subunit
MTIIAQRPTATPVRDTSPTAAGTPAATAPTGFATGTAARYVFGAVRLALGLTFLWAFADKLFGLGFATKAQNAWIDGGHPTQGFLANSAKGPFADFYTGIAGAPLVDWMFMMGLLGIGLALTLGIGMRIAAVSGALLYVMMWTVVLPPATNPILDDHLINAAVIVGLALIGAGTTLGLGYWWAKTPLVRKAPWLK